MGLLVQWLDFGSDNLSSELQGCRHKHKYGSQICYRIEYKVQDGKKQYILKLLKNNSNGDVWLHSRRLLEILDKLNRIWKLFVSCSPQRHHNAAFDIFNCVLCCRLKALTSWLGDCARSAIQKCHSASDDLLHRQGMHHPTPVSLASPAVIHVHCIATILWNNNERAVTDDLKRIVTKDLLRLAIY